MSSAEVLRQGDGPASSRASRAHSLLAPRIPTWARALVFYGIVAILTIGWHAVTHPRTVCACSGVPDAAAYMWAMSWWPHAIVHGLNPFVTHYQWSPTGVNLARAATIPTAAFVMAPVTALFGPIFSYNVVSVAGPALAAFTAYLLCRRLARRELPAVAGGYLFGFSSYEFGQLLGHLNLTLIFLIPVMVHLALRRIDREISRRYYVLAMALVLILQVGLSTELLVDSVLLGAVILISARLLVSPPQRGRIASLTVETIVAGVVAIVVTSLFLYYALFSGSASAPPDLGDLYGLDLANLVFPTDVTWLGHHDFTTLWTTFEGGNVSESNGYIGVAIVIGFAAWFFKGGHRSVLGRLLAIAIAVSFVWALGSHLHVAGRQTVTLPFNWVSGLPILKNIVPSRLIMFTSLAIAIGIAKWLSEGGGRRLVRWLLVAVGIVMLFPNLTAPLFGAPLVNPSFFATATYRKYLAPNETVLVLPFGYMDLSTLWQADTGFYFYMPEGYISGEIPSPFETEPGVIEMFRNTPPSPAVLESFLRAHQVSHVIVDPRAPGPWPSLLAGMGYHSQSVGDILLYSVRPASG